MLRQKGLAELIRHRRDYNDFATLESVNHPARPLLKFYRERGAPVKFSTKPWSREQIDGALQRGAHRSCFEHLEFLEDEFVDMIQKGQWIVLPASEVTNLTGLRLSPPGVVPQLGRRPRWIVDYTWSRVNADTLPLAPVEAMQFGHALDRILREIMLADPRMGPVKLLKVDLSDGFYRVHLNVDDIAKLGVVFPTRPGEEQLVALPLVLPMGWKNSPPIFSALTETIADLANWRLKHGYPSPPHHLDDEAESIVPEHPLTGLPMIPEESEADESDEKPNEESVITGDLTSQANQSCTQATASTPSNKIPPRTTESNMERPSTNAELRVDRPPKHAGKEPEASVETPDVPSQQSIQPHESPTELRGDGGPTFTIGTPRESKPTTGSASESPTAMRGEQGAPRSTPDAAPRPKPDAAPRPTPDAHQRRASRSKSDAAPGPTKPDAAPRPTPDAHPQQDCPSRSSAEDGAGATKSTSGNNSKCHPSVPVPLERDPSLPSQSRPLSYVDIFVDDFIGLAQDLTNGRRVRRILLHAIDDVIRPLSESDNVHRREPVSLKKLRQGDCSWSTVKQILGWVIDTVSMTIHLPPHRLQRLGELLASIPATQKRTSVKKWHKVLGELRSMSLALPGARHLFSHMQHALSSKLKGRVALNKGVHDALDDFRWILNDIASRPTRIAELVPLLASAEGHHDASGKGAGGIWFPANELNPRQGYSQKPVVWRYEWPKNIVDKLVTDDNPTGTISNSDLELAGGLIHLEALAQTFDVRERTLLSKTDNLNTLFWQRKGSATTEKVPAHLLRLFGIHQRYHRYVSRHDYLPGKSNPLADGLSRDFTLTWDEQMEALAPYLPEPDEYQIWTPSAEFMEAILSALLRKRVPPESLFVEPAQPVPLEQPSSGSPTLTWPSAPYSKPSRTKYEPYKSSDTEFRKETLRASEIPKSLTRLKVTYGSVPRRPRVWGPRSHTQSPQPAASREVKKSVRRR